MEKDKISIIVPIYNVEKYLPKCIESIINQTYKNLEIILVNDGSKDGCGEICDKFKNMDSRIIVIHKENGGLSDARNKGIEIATGEYIGFVDSDDWIEENMYQLLWQKLIQNDADISICGRFLDYEDGRSIIKSKKYYEKVFNKKEALIALNSFSLFDMSACDKLYKKILFDGTRYPFGKKCEDFYTTYKIFDKCNKIIYFSTPLYHYLQRQGSITKTKDPDRAYIDASLDQLEFFKEEYPELVYVAETMVAFANIFCYSQYLILNKKCNKDEKYNFKLEVRKRLKHILNNKYISVIRKIQASIFAVSLGAYSLIYKIIK